MPETEKSNGTLLAQSRPANRQCSKVIEERWNALPRESAPSLHFRASKIANPTAARKCDDSPPSSSEAPAPPKAAARFPNSSRPSARPLKSTDLLPNSCHVSKQARSCYSVERWNTFPERGTAGLTRHSCRSYRQTGIPILILEDCHQQKRSRLLIADAALFQ